MAKGLNTAAAILTGGLQGFFAAKREQREEDEAAWIKQLRARQMKQFDDQDAERALTLQGQKAGADVLTAARQKHIDSGGDPGMWKPTTLDVANAMEARGRTFSDAGRFDLYAKNHAEAAPLYHAAYQEVAIPAIEEFDSGDGPDHLKALKLAQTVYPALRDGRKIMNAKFVQGQNGGMDIEATLDNNTTVRMNPAGIRRQAQWALFNPEQRSKYEMETRLQDLQTQGKLKEIAAAGDEDRKTWDLRNEGDVRVARVRSETAKDVARTRVDGQIRVSQLRAAAGGGRGLGGGGKAPYLKSTTPLADGTLLANMSDGKSFIVTDDDGNPRVSAKAVDQALAGTKIVAGSIGGMRNTPDENAAGGAKLVRGLGTAVAPPKNAVPPIGKDFSPLWGE